MISRERKGGQGGKIKAEAKKINKMGEAKQLLVYTMVQHEAVVRGAGINRKRGYREASPD